MKSDKLQDAIGDIKGEYILEADVVGSDKRKRIAPTILKWVAAASCLVLVAGGAYTIFNNKKAPAMVADNLPKIEIGEYMTGGMGYEGYLEYSPDELKNGNPWNENNSLTTLPVFTSGHYDSTGIGIPLGLSEDEMKDRLFDTSDKLGISISDSNIEYISDSGYSEMIGLDSENDFVYAVCYSDSTLKITANADGMIQIEYLNGKSVPSEYTWTTLAESNDSISDNVLDYLVKEYASLLSYSNPKTYIYGYYSFSGDYRCRYYIYDESGDITESILNYNFNYAEFIPDFDSNLWIIKIYDHLTKAEKLGDYPLISSKEARKKLLKGEYQSSIYDYVPTSKDIVKVELVYRTGAFEKNLLPYYRFYVEMPSDNVDSENLGLKSYGAFYVPAIKEEYLSGLQIYDGSFN